MAGEDVQENSFSAACSRDRRLLEVQFGLLKLLLNLMELRNNVWGTLRVSQKLPGLGLANPLKIPKDLLFELLIGMQFRLWKKVLNATQRPATVRPRDRESLNHMPHSRLKKV
mgnify:CR=1 FL=1